MTPQETAKPTADRLSSQHDERSSEAILLTENVLIAHDSLLKEGLSPPAPDT
jgi:hypothetical protein